MSSFTLELNGIYKSYRKSGNEVSVLSDVSLSLSAGDFVAVQGPSGSGKTTLLLAAGGLLKPDSGGVKVMGEDMYSLTPESRARHRASNIGFVFQQFHLVSYLSVAENVMLPSLTCNIDNAEERAASLIDCFGLTDREHHVPSELSTGERQRTALARALLAGPKLLLADEPTGNLDSDNSKTVMEALGAFADEGGAVLWVTHDNTMAEHAHRTIFLDKTTVEV